MTKEEAKLNGDSTIREVLDTYTNMEMDLLSDVIAHAMNGDKEFMPTKDQIKIFRKLTPIQVKAFEGMVGMVGIAIEQFNTKIDNFVKEYLDRFKKEKNNGKR